MDQIVLARNTMPGPTVFSDGSSKNAVVEWKGAGDLMGEDIQPVPESVLSTVDFQRSVARGIFVIEQAPEEVERVLGLHKQEWLDRQSRAKAASEAALDNQPQNDLAMIGCILPNTNGTTCGVPVPVRMRTKNDAPVLCGQHKGFAGQFIAEPTEKLVDGKQEVRWNMVQQAPNTTQY